MQPLKCEGYQGLRGMTICTKPPLTLTPDDFQDIDEDWEELEKYQTSQK